MKKAHKICPKRKRQRGFTMIELMITVTLVAILASIAAPSMRTYVLNGRITSTTQELLRTLQTARSEATKRQRNAVVCASANPLAATDDVACATSGATGWIMFEDYSTDTATTNNDWDRDSSEALIEVHSIESSKMKILANGSQRISYAATGFAATGNGAAPQIKSTGIVVCDSRGNVDSGGGTSGPSVARGIVISDSGRARITRVVSSSSDSSDVGELLSATGGSCS